MHSNYSTTGPARAAWLPITAAMLVMVYHVQNCSAESEVLGSAANNYIDITWHYTLRSDGGGSGILHLSLYPNCDPPEEGHRLLLAGLIPDGATVTEVNDIWNNQGAVDYSVETCAPDFNDPPPGCDGVLASDDALVTDFSCFLDVIIELSPDFTYAETDSTLIHGTVCGTPGDGVCMSASPCLGTPLGCVDEFVTVVPIVAACVQGGDFDHDGDVDLLDYARFQELFTGPE